ncbi:3887_t:CDS:2 [Paraglomus occultum]|uniref:3887_t:CDS:1 n=1 Tax=Paraglomus occultum TaxID=144539 RepID=A0A9N9FD89_9GLOM|nr:3887_t:CDS:2 [Paraglomus occultum]
MITHFKSKCDFGENCEKELAPYYDTCKIKNSFALTFDDGPHKDAKSTFFVCGHTYSCIYDNAETLRRAYLAGHQIALHTWSHPNLNTLTRSEIHSELTSLETALRKIIGAVPRYFRLPYGAGASNATLMNVLREYNYTVIGWDIDSGDSVGSTVETSKMQYTNVLKWMWLKRRSHISLNHDPIESTSKILINWVIKYIRGFGYEFRTIGECLGEKDWRSWYKEITTSQERDETWVC